MSSRARSTPTSPSNLQSQFSAIVAAPFGAIGVRCSQQTLQELVYLPPSFAPMEARDALSASVAHQIEAYWQDPHFQFDLPLPKLGTAFQQKVWAAIAAIPCGSVLTYGQVAKQVQSAPRAVGQACGANWFPLIIPCHRVTASAGLGGFANHDDAQGFHLGVKRYLLAHEKVAGFYSLQGEL